MAKINGNIKEVKKVKIEYTKDPLYTPLFVSGVVGSPTPKGDIVMNFYTDLPGIPSAQVYEIKDGRLGAEIVDKREPAIIRYGDTATLFRHIQTGVIIKIADAKALQSWLGEQIMIIEQQFPTITENVKKQADDLI